MAEERGLAELGVEAHVKEPSMQTAVEGQAVSACPAQISQTAYAASLSGEFAQHMLRAAALAAARRNAVGPPPAAAAVGNAAIGKAAAAGSARGKAAVGKAVVAKAAVGKAAATPKMKTQSIQTPRRIRVYRCTGRRSLRTGVSANFVKGPGSAVAVAATKRDASTMTSPATRRRARSAADAVPTDSDLGSDSSDDS